jgi:hypothetical protein
VFVQKTLAAEDLPARGALQVAVAVCHDSEQRKCGEMQTYLQMSKSQFQHVSSSLSLSLALSKVVNSSTLLISLLLGGNRGNGNTAASE